MGVAQTLTKNNEILKQIDKVLMINLRTIYRLLPNNNNIKKEMFEMISYNNIDKTPKKVIKIIKNVSQKLEDIKRELNNGNINRNMILLKQITVTENLLKLILNCELNKENLTKLHKLLYNNSGKKPTEKALNEISEIILEIRKTIFQ